MNLPDIEAAIIHQQTLPPLTWCGTNPFRPEHREEREFLIHYYCKRHECWRPSLGKGMTDIDTKRLFSGTIPLPPPSLLTTLQ